MYVIIDWLPAPLYCIIVIIVKQAFGNHRLLADYNAEPMGAGLGRDNPKYKLYLKHAVHHS